MIETLEESSEIETDTMEKDDIATIIGFVLNLEYERAKKTEDPARVTMQRDSARHSNWGIFSRMRAMPQRRMNGKI